MKSFAGRHFRSITLRLFLIFLVIWGVFSAFVAVALRWTEQTLANGIVREQAERVSYYSAIVNADLNRITSMLARMSVDEDVSDFLHKREQDRKFEFQDYVSYLRSMDKLKSYLASSMYIDDVFLVIPTTGELLSANSSVISIPEAYSLPIDSAASAEREVFFAVDDTMVYLSQGGTGVTVGVEVSVRHIKSMLNALNPGYFDCFLINGETGELLGKNLLSADARAIYQGIAESAGADADPLAATPFRHESGAVTAGNRDYLYDTVKTLGNHFIICIFAEEQHVYADLHAFRMIWAILSIVILLLPLLMGFMMRRMLSRPMKKLTLGMGEVEHENYSVRLPERESTEFNYVFHQFNAMAARIETLIGEVYETRIQAEQAKRRQLQAQINPHFLFNSFYMGYRMAKNGETGKVANLCMYLGDYFKTLTYVSDQLIPLTQELQFVETYLKLNAMRFRDKLSYRLDVEPGLEDQLIYPLLLQPVVENAIRHGVERVQSPCTIVISVRAEGSRMRLCVEDDCGQTDETTVERLKTLIARPGIPEDSMGLWNVEKRLRTLGGNEYGLVFERKADGVFSVEFSFPMKQYLNETIIPGREGAYVQPADRG